MDSIRRSNTTAVRTSKDQDNLNIGKSPRKMKSVLMEFRGYIRYVAILYIIKVSYILHYGDCVGL